MAEHIIEFDQECESCGGTGLYIGFAESDGAAIVCHTCRGEGHHQRRIVYRDFKFRAGKPGVRRVFQVNPGIGIGTGGGYTLEDFGGVSYHNWRIGLPFPRGSEMRKFTCPAWWYQSADYNLKPRWSECMLVGAFDSCPLFCDKATCWERWDAENP